MKFLFLRYISFTYFTFLVKKCTYIYFYILLNTFILEKIKKVLVDKTMYDLLVYKIHINTRSSIGLLETA